MLAFWQNVNQLIKSKNITQETLANKIGIQKYTFYSWITRDILPRVDDAYKIAQALNTTVEFLLTGNSTNPAEVELKELKQNMLKLLNQPK